MTYWLILHLTYACPGGWLGGAIPAAVRPYVCSQRPAHEFAGHRAEAVRRVRELGPGARTRLYWCRGLRCWERAVRWVPTLEVEP